MMAPLKGSRFNSDPVNTITKSSVPIASDH
jgi:hypothetical protein